MFTLTNQRIITLLLAHTSLTFTSLELLQVLKFSDIKGVYTYSSPDMEYFHGRHTFYGTVSIIVTVVIVIGPPFFLLLEPLLSRRVNFNRMRPILHHFQEPYKFKYRYFAAFYPLCRLAIIEVFYNVHGIYDRSFVMQVLCVVITIIHAYFMPYKSLSLNILDLVILIILTFVVSFNTTFFLTSLDSTVFSAILIVIITAPLIITCVILIFNRVKRCIPKKDNDPIDVLINASAEDECADEYADHDANHRSFHHIDLDVNKYGALDMDEYSHTVTSHVQKYGTVPIKVVPNDENDDNDDDNTLEISSR